MPDTLHAVREPLIMGGDDERGVGVHEHREQRVHQVIGRGPVELPGWFIGKDQSGLSRERAGNPDPLRLPPGQLFRQFSREIAERETIQHRACGLLGAVGRDVVKEERQRDVLPHREGGQQTRGLEHEGDATGTQVRAIAERGPENRALRRYIEAAEEVQQGGFAAPRMPHEGNALPRTDGTGRRNQRNVTGTVVRIGTPEVVRYDTLIASER